MVGFLAIASLTGIAAAAWPIYLHLRRERRVRLQEVPSLRIFRWRTRPARRKRVEDLLLLAARVGAITALALLAAQPFLSTTRKLPLLPLGDVENENRLLGLVIDDSLSSLHGATEGARFENARAWLLGQLEVLPESVDVSVATTTYPRPTSPLARDDAISLLAKMRPVMKEGNASEALSRMAELVRGRGGALVVAASREEGLWPAPGGGKPAGTIRQAWFLDTTGWRTDA